MSAARFRIKRFKQSKSERPWVLADRTRPHWSMQFASLEAALLRMDNIVRVEFGFPPRVHITTAEILEHMEPTA